MHPVWTDILTAIGTVVTGVAAVAGLGLTVWFSQRERHVQRRAASRGGAIQALEMLDGLERDLTYAFAGSLRPAFAKGNDPATSFRESAHKFEFYLRPQIQDEAIRTRGHELTNLFRQAPNAYDGSSESARTNRMMTDMGNYLVYVRHTIEAFLDEVRAPRDKPPPNLKRQDDLCWEAPGPA